MSPERRLPLLANARQKLVGALLAIAACALLYGGAAALTADRAVTVAVPSWERAIPYLPLSVWAYLAQYPLLVVAYYGTGADLRRCSRFLYALVMVQAAAAATYLVLPLRYPRAESSDHPAGIDPLTAALVEGVHSLDAPVNCFPSLHVTSGLLCMALVGRRRTPLAFAIGVVAFASIVSTLTFKQHYAIDLPAGALYAAVAWWAAGRLLPRSTGTAER